MAIEPAFFDHLVLNDGYLPSFLQQNESKDEVLCASLEARLAEELQFQEALQASLICCQMPGNVLSSTPSTTNMEANSGRKIEPSPQVLEKGKSSLSSCDICLNQNPAIPGNADSEMPVDRGNGGFQTRSRYFKSTAARSLDRPPVGQRSNKRGGIDRPPGKGSDAGQERVANDSQERVANDIQINHIDVVGDLSDTDAFDDNDESDSDPSGKDPEKTKKSTPMKEFLVILEKLAPADVNETTRQWLCPVCEGGSGATKGYQGLWALILHAKTKPGKRVKLHQELAQQEMAGNQSRRTTEDSHQFVWMNNKVAEEQRHLKPPLSHKPSW